MPKKCKGDHDWETDSENREYIVDSIGVKEFKHKAFLKLILRSDEEILFQKCKKCGETRKSSSLICRYRPTTVYFNMDFIVMWNADKSGMRIWIKEHKSDKIMFRYHLTEHAYNQFEALGELE